MKRYEQIRICKKCRYKDTRFLSLIEASFDKTSDWKEPCRKCGNLVFRNLPTELPGLSREALELWGLDETLKFWDQDEDLLIAENNNLGLLVEYVDKKSILKSKRIVLLAALCTLLFDNIQIEEDDPNFDGDYDLGNQVKSILLDRLDYFNELDSNYIPFYIKEIVYPELGLKLFK